MECNPNITELYIIDVSNTEISISQIYSLIEDYNYVLGGNKKLHKFIDLLFTKYNANLFDWIKENPYSSIGNNIVFLESFRLEKESWIDIRKIAHSFGLIVFDDINRLIYKPEI